jgi:acyl-CoA dehydrogenase
MSVTTTTPVLDLVEGDAAYHDLPAETRALLRRLAEFLEAEVVTRHAANEDLFGNPRRVYDESGRYSDAVMALRREVRLASARAGLYTAFVPESLGGGGGSATSMYSAWELVYRACGSEQWLAWDVVAHWVTGPSEVFSDVTPALREEVLPELMSGEKTSCFGMSEPNAGSDVWNLETRAVRDGDGWRITGRKQWTSNGPTADYALVFAITDPETFTARRGGISAFMVPTASEGFRVERVMGLFGHIGSNEAVIALDEVRVEDYQLVGELHRGLDAVGFLGLSLGRLYNAGKSVGLSRWALAKALAWAKERRTFGKSLIEHQALAFSLADVATETLAAHLMGLHHARLLDRGEQAVKEGAMSKLYSTEAASRSLDRIVQVLGGRGLTNEVGIAEAWQLIRVVRIADGSAEMLRRLIAGRLAKGDVAL